MSCNKDTVEKTRLQKWSRGIYIIASAGGHIEYWQPLSDITFNVTLFNVLILSFSNTTENNFTHFNIFFYPSISDKKNGSITMQKQDKHTVRFNVDTYNIIFSHHVISC